MKQEHGAGILIILISLLLQYSPERVWKLTEAWKSSKDASPSRAYVIALRCLGVVFLITGIVVLCSGWILR